MMKMVIVLKNTASQQQVEELTPQAFTQVMKKIKALAEFMGKPVDNVG